MTRNTTERALGPVASAALLAGGIWLGTSILKRMWRRTADVRGRVALVTGGSRGLGLLIAKELGRAGMKVVIAARDSAELDRARQQLLATGIEDVSTIVTDLAEDADAELVVAAVIERHGSLDLLVNNAGTIKVGPFDHMTGADYDEAMAVHLWAPLRTMRAAIPHMRAQGGGRIVNISSIGGKVGVPHLVPYCASKFALTGLSTAMGAELRRDGISVTTVCPGLMRTGSFFNAWFKGQHRQEFAWFAIADSTPVLSVSAQRAAEQVVDAALRGDAELVIGWPARLAVVASAALPNTFAALMAFSNRLLPSPTESGTSESHAGWQSTSRWAPSVLTRLSDGPAAQNNELPAS